MMQTKFHFVNWIKQNICFWMGDLNMNEASEQANILWNVKVFFFVLNYFFRKIFHENVKLMKYLH